MLVCGNGGYGRFRFFGCFVVGPRKEISTVVVGLHFGGRRSGLCRGFEEGDLIAESMGMVSLPWV